MNQYFGLPCIYRLTTGFQEISCDDAESLLKRTEISRRAVLYITNCRAMIPALQHVQIESVMKIRITADNS